MKLYGIFHLVKSVQNSPQILVVDNDYAFKVAICLTNKVIIGKLVYFW